MLLFQNPRRQCLNRVIRKHRDFSLRDDWAAIQSLIDKMNGAAAKFRAAVQRLLLRIKSGKRWQQARMNIQNAAAIRCDKFARKDAHVTGEAN